MQKRQLRKPSPKTQWPRKNIPGRRRFAPAEPVGENSRFEGRRDENAKDACPLAREDDRGENTAAPYPLATVLESLASTQKEHHDVVCRVLHLGSADLWAVATRRKAAPPLR
jgi:hypothetical protein